MSLPPPKLRNILEEKERYKSFEFRLQTAIFQTRRKLSEMENLYQSQKYSHRFKKQLSELKKLHSSVIRFNRKNQEIPIDSLKKIKKILASLKN